MPLVEAVGNVDHSWSPPPLEHALYHPCELSLVTAVLQDPVVHR